MLPLVKKWQIVSGYYDLKSHFRSNDHMLFALNLSYAFSSSLLVFSHINIGAKIMIFFLNCREWDTHGNSRKKSLPLRQR